MGVLGASGGVGGVPPAPEPEGEAPAPAEPGEAPPPAPAEDVAPSDYAPARRKDSRRARADADFDERIKGHIGEFRKQWDGERDTLQQQLAQERQERARLAGQLEALQRMPPPAAPPVAENRPDPAELRRQAKKALDEKDFESYERLRDQATVIEATSAVEERFGKRFSELQQQIPQQAPPEIQFLMAQHRHVALAGPRGVQAVMIKDQELGLYGVPAGPDRVAKAFELADKMLGPRQQPGRPTYGQEAATALGGVPAGRGGGTGGGGGGGGDDGEALTGVEKDVARSMKMTEADYRKWKHPEKFVKR